MNRYPSRPEEAFPIIDQASRLRALVLARSQGEPLAMAEERERERRANTTARPGFFIGLASRWALSRLLR